MINQVQRQRAHLNRTVASSAPRPSARRGMVVLMVLAALGVVAVLSAQLVRGQQVRRRGLQLQTMQLQAELLLHSAAARVQNRLAVDPSYRGEQWKPWQPSDSPATPISTVGPPTCEAVVTIRSTNKDATDRSARSPLPSETAIRCEIFDQATKRLLVTRQRRIVHSP